MELWTGAHVPVASSARRPASTGCLRSDSLPLAKEEQSMLRCRFNSQGLGTFSQRACFFASHVFFANFSADFLSLFYF